MRVLMILVALAAVSVPASASAFTLLDKEDLTLQLKGWGQGGYAVLIPDTGDTARGAYVGMGRVSLGAQKKDVGRFFLQLEGASGDAKLLDLVAQIDGLPLVHIRAGKFKAPTSLEYLIAGPSHPFVNRALLVGLVPTRHVGAELVTHSGSGVEGQVGLFRPAGANGPDAGRELLVGRVVSTAVDGLTLHASFTEVLGDEPGAMEPPDGIVHTRIIDVAVAYADEHLFAHAEVAAVVDSALEENPLGVTAWVGYNFGGAIPPEVVVGYDLVQAGDVRDQRARAGLNLYFWGERLVHTWNYELILNDGADAAHAIYGQLQAGF